MFLPRLENNSVTLINIRNHWALTLQLEHALKTAQAFNLGIDHKETTRFHEFETAE
jgi:hypothetical protein